MWPAADSVTQLQLEHCFMLPDLSSQEKVRVKVVQNFRRSWAARKPWQLASVDLHKEK